MPQPGPRDPVFLWPAVHGRHLSGHRPWPSKGVSTVAATHETHRAGGVSLAGLLLLVRSRMNQEEQWLLPDGVEEVLPERARAILSFSAAKSICSHSRMGSPVKGLVV